MSDIHIDTGKILHLRNLIGFVSIILSTLITLAVALALKHAPDDSFRVFFTGMIATCFIVKVFPWSITTTINLNTVAGYQIQQKENEDPPAETKLRLVPEPKSETDPPNEAG